MRRIEPLFAALVATQAAHSLEEWWYRLYDVFPPARLLTSLVSSDRERGFVAINLVLVAFGFWCVAVPVHRRWPSAATFVGFWIAIELVNGVGHPLWSILQGGYTPGVVTAPILLVLALVLARRTARYATARRRTHEPSCATPDTE
jgi:hypothetical protein